MTKSMKERNLAGIRDQINKDFMKSLRLKEETPCAICLVEFVAPCQVTVLGCNPGHIFHKKCAEEWISHNKSKRMTPACPMCRVPINEPLMKNAPYKGLESDATASKPKNA